jgi:hypothetical protein
MLVAISPERRARHVFSDQAVEDFRREHGIDLSALCEYRPPASRPIMFSPAELEEAMIGPPTTIASIDLGRFEEVAVSGRVELSLPEGRAAEHLGVAISFRAELSPDVALSPVLPDIDLKTSWLFPVFMAPDDFRAAPGATVKIGYEYRRHRTDITFDI